MKKIWLLLGLVYAASVVAMWVLSNVDGSKKITDPLVLFWPLYRFGLLKWPGTNPSQQIQIP